MGSVTCDFSNITAKIKPLHGFNNCARKTGYGEVLPDFLALKPPAVRLHDTGFPHVSSHYVDINHVFPDMNADENDERSYDFMLTDLYIEPLIKAGVGVMYRLGTTIEHDPKKYNIAPPADPNKWASVCEHIVRHYNDGWANGHYWNIEYWEVWNEPDGLDKNVEPFGPPNWLGTAGEYYRLYSVTANLIKRMHHSVKVGGYSSCYILGANVAGKWTVGETSFLTGFLEYISSPSTAAPLDFFSWHGYLSRQNLKKIETESEFVDRMLTEYGFESAERIDTEWSACICDRDCADTRTQYYINMRSAKGASHMAGALYEMQRCKVDKAMFYDAQIWCEYGALFEVPSLAPSKAYYAFRQFGEAYEAGNQVECAAEGDGIYALAAKSIDSNKNLVCICNTAQSDAEIEIKLNGILAKQIEIIRCDSEHSYEQTDLLDFTRDFSISLPAYSFVTLRINH